MDMNKATGGIAFYNKLLRIFHGNACIVKSNNQYGTLRNKNMKIKKPKIFSKDVMEMKIK